MAEVIARSAALTRGQELEFRSAGVFAPAGSPASAAAQAVAAQHGLDLSDHRATLLDREALEWADLVLGMTHGHVDAVRRQAPDLPTVPITGFLETENPRAGMGIEDPYGGTVEEYERVWSELVQAVEAMLERLSGATGSA